MSDSCVLPDFDDAEAAEYASRLFGLSGPLRRLDGERDLNFRIGEPGTRFVFKIANAGESPAMLECQHLVFEKLAAARVFPHSAKALESVNGKSIEALRSKAGVEHFCRVLPFIEGRMLSQVARPSAALLEDVGRCLGRLDRALGGFDHPALERPLLGKMDNALDVLASFKPLLADGDRRQLVEHYERGYRARVLPAHTGLRRAAIHNDANRANLLVDESGEKVISIIDFGDMVESWLVVEPVIAATYAMLERGDPLAAAASVFRGYRGEIPLRNVETELAFDFICMRLCMSVCINAHQRALEPDNEYLDVDVDAAWELLRYLQEIEPAAAQNLLFPDR